MGFTGLPAAGADFYAELRFNNDRDWWLANKPRWERDVRAPLQALADALASEFGAARLFRPNRDVRFSADKSPYKDHQGVVVHTGPAMGYYVAMGAEGLMTGGGWYSPEPATVARFRSGVDDDDLGDSLEGIVDDLVAGGFEVGGDELKTAPRGFSADHPRIALLRRKTLVASAQRGTPEWLESPEAFDRVRDDWLAYQPLVNWLAAHAA